jgi:hypothetical protein
MIVVTSQIRYERRPGLNFWRVISSLISSGLPAPTEVLSSITTEPHRWGMDHQPKKSPRRRDLPRTRMRPVGSHRPAGAGILRPWPHLESPSSTLSAVREWWPSRTGSTVAPFHRSEWRSGWLIGVPHGGMRTSSTRQTFQPSPSNHLPRDIASPEKGSGIAKFSQNCFLKGHENAERFQRPALGIGQFMSLHF